MILGDNGGTDLLQRSLASAEADEIRGSSPPSLTRQGADITSRSRDEWAKSVNAYF
jgi:hypothetical protein